MRRITALFGVVALTGCQPDESITAYAGEHTIFALQSINGERFEQSATIDVSVADRISGRAPCNSYFAAQSAPYPWFKIGPIAATRRACPDLEAEHRFFASLGQMTLAEVAGRVLILSNTDGGEMVFQALP